jgi:hypothetical protein
MFKRLVWKDKFFFYDFFKIDNGYKFAIVRAYRNNGIVDANSPRTIKNARAAGLNYVDAYLLPCISCGDAPQQVKE